MYACSQANAKAMGERGGGPRVVLQWGRAWGEGVKVAVQACWWR